VVLDVLNRGVNPRSINKMFLCFIPKIKDPRHTGDFRPISLCNVLFKLITKTIANRLKIILPNIVVPFQSAFVPGRLITNNALIAFESFHHMMKKKKRDKGYVRIKLDISKAYDRGEMEFFGSHFTSYGFSGGMGLFDYELCFYSIFLCAFKWKALPGVYIY